MSGINSIINDEEFKEHLLKNSKPPLLPWEWFEKETGISPGQFFELCDLLDTDFVVCVDRIKKLKGALNQEEAA